MRLRVLTAILLTCFGTAFAGTIHVRRGTLDFESVVVGDGPVHLEGDRHFSFDGFAQLARLDAADCSFPCEPRETVSLFATVVGNDLPGVVELGDQTFTDVGGLVSLSSMSLTITGQGTVPLMGKASTKIKSYPVKLVGEFVHYEGIPYAPVIENLVAKAKAIVTWTKYVDDPEYWVISHLTYRIGPDL